MPVYCSNFQEGIATVDDVSSLRYMKTKSRPEPYYTTIYAVLFHISRLLQLSLYVEIIYIHNSSNCQKTSNFLACFTSAFIPTDDTIFVSQSTKYCLKPLYVLSFCSE